MKYLYTLSILIFLYSCTSPKKQVPSYSGVWKSIGHGKILEIVDSTTYTNYDITSISCFPVQERNFNELLPYLSLKSDTLTFKQGQSVYKYSRLGALPDLCQNHDPSKNDDVLFNFEVFMQTVKENYAFMELNRINWDQLYQNQKGKLNAGSSPAELYLLLEETYELLNDNHAFLNAPDEVYDAIEKSSPQEESTTEGLPEYGDFTVAQLVTQHHLQENMTENSEIIHWGKLTDNIGYIQIKAMWLYGDLDIPNALLEREGFVDAYSLTRISMLEANYKKKEVEGVKKIMSRVMHDLSDTKSIVMDVRFNGGGQDVVSYAILSYFNAERTQIATQEFRYGDNYTRRNALFLEGNDTAYTKPVYVLTSPQSGSGAETFALGTMSIPHIKRIGSATEGAMSTTLDKKLPNGWDFTVSSEVYRDNTGRYYENIGVPVDYELYYIRGNRQDFFRSVVNNLDKDKKEILKAIQNLQLK